MRIGQGNSENGVGKKFLTGDTHAINIVLIRRRNEIKGWQWEIGVFGS